MITQERLKEVLDYNELTGDFTRRSTGKLVGTMDTNGYIKIMIDGRRYQAHKLAWFYVHGVWVMVDHADRKRWNNPIANLRKSTYQQNAANREQNSGNTSTKGVYFRAGFYEVGIKINQKRIYLGRYKTLEEAKQAYATSAIEHFGEFAQF